MARGACSDDTLMSYAASAEEANSTLGCSVDESTKHVPEQEHASSVAAVPDPRMVRVPSEFLGKELDESLLRSCG
jgi:hypothetical protein